jgi:DNA primase
LLSELNKMRQAKAKKDSQQQQSSQSRYAEMPDEPHFFDEPVIIPEPVKEESFQEKEIIRLLLLYGNRMIDWDGIANTYIGPFIIAELGDVTFEHAACKMFVELYRAEVENGVLPEDGHFIHHRDKSIVDITVDLLTSKYTLSENWMDMHGIMIHDETSNMKAAILGAIFHLKKHKVEKILEGLRTELKNADNQADQEILLDKYMRMKKVEKSISDFLGSVIIK